jgi:CubicO group peptidase (beta-lactamase class C family)
MDACMTIDRLHWQRRLDELARKSGVPGAVLAVSKNGELAEAASGVLNVETGVETTRDSVFQIGSVTKPYTATLVMQLVAEGRLGLDEPVSSILPDLRLGDAEATGRVTMRHLLTHTSGVQGDVFDDFGRGDDALEKFVAGCSDLGFSHPVGATMSYCNTGYVIAGRVVEVVTGQTWDAALRERLLEPLGLRHTMTLPEEVLRFRAAHGHVGEPGEEPRLAPVWGLPRSLGPAGLVCATAADMVAFGRMHLAAGRSSVGDVVLPEPQVVAMQSAQVTLPDPWTLGADHWGLGWFLMDWNGRRVVGHDGSTVGQAAYLRLVPDSDVVVALVMNGGDVEQLERELFAEVLSDLADLQMPPVLEPPPLPPLVHTEGLAGRYERVGVRIELAGHEGRLSGTVTLTGPLAEFEDDPSQPVDLVPVADGVFATRSEDERSWTPVVFYELADGSRYLHMAARATPKVD